MKKLFISLLFVVILVSHGEAKYYASIFSNNMVVQQSSIIKFWGEATANETLTIKCSWLESAFKVKANLEGNWSTDIKTPAADFKSHTISITGNEHSDTLSNILFGEVWLCSGQSNMEMILMDQPDYNLKVEGSAEEISKADYPNIRFLNVDRKPGFYPNNSITSNGWQIVTPDKVKWLSAIAYFYGKKLYEDLNVPIGLIVNAYGGSPIQAWIGENFTSNRSLYIKAIEERNANIKAAGQTEAEYIQSMRDWISESEKFDNSFLPIELPVNMEFSEYGNQLGELQFIRKISLSDISEQPFTLHLGTMNDLGRVYLNGELVWEELRNSRSYSNIQVEIPANKLRVGENELEIRLLNILWGGGLTGPASEMYYSVGKDGIKKSLAGTWTWRKLFDLAEVKPIPQEGIPLFSNISALYNGIIFPLKNYKIKGCVWYQGESNVSEWEIYPEMFKDMILSWRHTFKYDFPFYYVQIAPYRYGDANGTQAGALRNAQAITENQLPHTGMIVSLDVGDPANIHPAKKRELGERLANMALAKTYSKAINYKFPKVKSVARKNNYISIKLKDLYNGIVIDGEKADFELSDDGTLYYPASFEIKKNTIRLSSPELKKPLYIRYCFRDEAKGTIFNSEKLPLGTFLIQLK